MLYTLDEFMTVFVSEKLGLTAPGPLNLFVSYPHALMVIGSPNANFISFKI